VIAARLDGGDGVCLLCARRGHVGVFTSQGRRAERPACYMGNTRTDSDDMELALSV
jgi:hypothetical protein